MADLSSDLVLTWTRDSVCVHSLPEAGVVHVRGDDARSWLNGQTTNDIREVGEDHAVYALSVDVKGRIQTDLWVVAEADGLAFVAPRAAIPALLEAFDRYIIMEDVELSLDEDLSVVTLQGPLAAKLAEAQLGGLRQVHADRLGAGGIDCWIPKADLAAKLEALSQAASELGGGVATAEAWAAAHVAAGVPRYGADFGSDTYPQEVGLKDRAVSFNKGCYLGQEVICMLENRGKLARRLAMLEAWPGSDAKPGDACANEKGAKVGHVTSVSDGEEPRRALAFLKRGHDTLDLTLRIGNGTWTVKRIVGNHD